MKYLVDNRYFYDGTIKVKIIEAPENAQFEYFIAGKTCDIWFDVFETYEEAKVYADECEKCSLENI